MMVFRANSLHTSAKQRLEGWLSLTARGCYRLGFSLLLMSLWLFSAAAQAAQVNVLGSATATASGSGASGTPSISSFNIPAGKNRVLFIWAAFERDHCNATDNCTSGNTTGVGLGDNWPDPRTGTAPNTTTNNQITASVAGPGSTINKKNAMTIGGSPSGDLRFQTINPHPNTTPSSAAYFSVSSFHIALFENEINTLLGGASSGNVNINLLDVNVPNHVGDEAMLIASVYENVEQTAWGMVRNAFGAAQVVNVGPPAYTAGNYAMTVSAYDASPGAPAPAQTPDEANDGKLVMGLNTSMEGFLPPAGHSVLASVAVSNNNGVFDTTSVADYDINEPNGFSANAYFRNGGASPSSGYTLTSATASTTRVYGGLTQSYLLESDNADTSDAPSTYGHPTHAISGIRLGASVDADAAILANATATGDDTNGTDDENGVTMPATLTVDSISTVPVNIQNASGYLNAWFDWNLDGDFLDAGEQIATDQAVAAGTTNLSITPPLTATAGASFARFRVCTTTASCNTPTSADNSGEVEDYALTIIAAGPLAPTPNIKVGASRMCGTIGTDKVAGTLNECPDSKVVVGIRHTDRAFAVPNGGDGMTVNLDLLCASVNTDGTTASVTVDGTYTDFSGFDQAGATTTATCPAGMVAQRMGGWDRDTTGWPWTSAIRLGCRPLQVDSLGRVQVNTSAAETLVSAGAIEGNAPHTFRGLFGGQDVYDIIKGYRPQNGGEGFDGINVSCAPLLNNDHGDAPASNGDAQHLVNLGTHYLGSGIPDAETSALTPLDGSGDDNNRNDDENGVTLPTLVQGQTATITATVTGAGGYLQGWIDFNGDGDFIDAGEQIATNLQDGGGLDTNATTGTVAFTVNIPTNTTTTQTYARFRWSSTSGLDASTAANNGEVEDYALTLISSTVSIGNANYCTVAGGTLGANLFTANGSFGTGSSTPGTTGSPLAGGVTTYTFANYTNNTPGDASYSIVNQLNQDTFSYWFNPVSGHTTGAVTDQMMVVNADFSPGIFYRESLAVTSNTNYQFSTWLLNLPNPASWLWAHLGSDGSFDATGTLGGTAGDVNSPGGIKPDLSFMVNRIGVDDNNDGTVDEPGEGQILFNTDALPFTTVPTWKPYGSVFNSGNATQVEFFLRNNAPGGGGNDLALDDLLVAPCILANGAVSGVLYRDNNSNNTYDSGIDALMPANIAVDLLDSNGVILSTAYTDAQGVYSFTNIPVGTNYTLSVALTDPDIPAGATPTATPSGAGTTGNQAGINITNGGTITDQNFGFSALPKDYSDAPTSGTAPNGSGTNSYGTPSHTIVAGVHLGATAADAETATLPSSNADGDDNDGTDDEDGVTLPSLAQGQVTTLSATVAGAGGYLQGWIDFNGDGDFADSGEQIATNLQDNGTGDTNATAGMVAFNVNVPANAVTTQTYARFRWSSSSNLDSTTAANDGEVEDYALTISAIQSLSGMVFEDINYAGGAGRDLASAAGVGVAAATVELYNASGALVGTTTKAANGSYTFNSVVAGNYYVRVVNNTVNSSRTGTNGSELGVQTFRTDGTTAVTGEVGGRNPAIEDSASNTGAQTLNTTTFVLSGSGQTQSVTPITLASSNMTGIDFGFNFDTIVNTNDAGQGSLRQFILNSNLLKNNGLAQSGLTAGTETSIFQLTGTAPFTITPSSALPAISDSYTAVDATTQAGTSCAASTRTLVVQLDGSSSGANIQGITVSADHALIRGLSIGNYTESGIYATSTGTDLTVQCNNLGLKADGTTLAKNTFYGLYDNGGANLTVGGTSDANRNIISGNGKDGVRLYGVNTALIQNNYVGTTASGTAALSNNQETADYSGIILTGAALATGSKNISITDNVISGNDKGVANTTNTSKGIKAIYASVITITNNRIGTTPDGMTALSNTGYGIYTQNATDIVIGGTTAAERNIISGNQQDGINTRFGTNRITIYGNYIGFGSDGIKAIGNANNGIFLADTSNALIGNSSASGRNIIGNNTLSGIRNSTSNATQITDNYIGTDVSGSLDKGNILHGVYVQNSDNVVIGGAASADANLIAYNKVIGIFTERTLASTVNTNTLVEHNYIGILKDGETAAGNTQSGVETKYNTGVTVRNNTISANKTRGIHVYSSPSTTITNNRIGTNAAGTSDQGNLQYGIDINIAAANLTITNNTISGNEMAGVRLINGDATNTSAIYDNRIGTNSSGTAAIGNTLDGILVDSAPNVIIGSSSNTANTVAGNARNGILISGSAAQSVKVLNNLIGLNSAGSSLANAGQGILVQTSASNISIGDGTSTGANKIAYNGDNGIALSGSTPSNVNISQNSIYANTNLGIDLGLDTVTLDDANDTDTGANTLINFPILTATNIAGSNLIVSGCAPTGASIEFFEADVSPTSSSAQAAGANKATRTQDYGEGEHYLATLVEGTGEDTTTNPVNCTTLNDADGNSAAGMSPFQWTLALPSNLVLGDKLTATASVSGTGTSEFSAVALIDSGKNLSGIVFEDVNYGGGAGRSQTAATGVGVNGATVELYSSTGALVASTTTANDGTNDGAYSFSSVSAGDYYVRVVNNTVSSTRTGSTGAELAVQTFRTDGTTAVTGEVGGRVPALGDGAANTGSEVLNTSNFVLGVVNGGSQTQSIQPVTIASADVTDVDFGFNFDTIVNTNDAGQGSLRQFILNSNLLTDLPNQGLITGKESAIFMIPDGTAYAGTSNHGTLNLTSGGVAKINASNIDRTITDAHTAIDASTQNGASCEPRSLKVQLDGLTSGTDEIGLEVTGSGVVIRGLSITNFTDNAIALWTGGDNALITCNHIGVSPDGMTAAGNLEAGIAVSGGLNAKIGDGTQAERNIIGGNGISGVSLQQGSMIVDTNIIGLNLPQTAALPNNEGVMANSALASQIINNIIQSNTLHGIRVDATSSNLLIQNNTITANNDIGIAAYPGSNQFTILDNTITNNTNVGILTNGSNTVSIGDGTAAGRNIISGNGQAGIYALATSNLSVDNNYIGLLANNAASGNGLVGIAVNAGSSGIVLTHNTVAHNNGPGIAVLDPSVALIKENSIYANTGLGIDLNYSIGVNAVTLNDANDTDTGSNSLLNFPQFKEINVVGANLIVSGCAPAGSTIELFEADVSPSSSSGVVAGANQFGKTLDYGEGERYLLSLTEGVGEDAASSSISCATVTDTDANSAAGMSPFQWTLALPSNLALGDQLTATATLAGTGTSEFSAAALIGSGKNLSGIVFEDVNYGGGLGRSQTAATGVGVNGATVELYSSTGALVASTTTANDGTNDGAYSFSSVSAGDYYVRVVNNTVSSTRTGSTGAELAVQTFRTDGTTAVTGEVGGRMPSSADATANAGTETLNTSTFLLSGGGQVQSATAITMAGTDITGVDFGFNFDTIVNTNDAGQGSLRQFILNSNLLTGEASLAQAGSRKRLDNSNEALPAASESSIFMIPSSALTAGVAKIQIASGASLLPSVTGDKTILDATTQTTNIGDTNNSLLGTGGTVGIDALTLPKIPAPEVELFPAAAGYSYGLHLNNTAVILRGFAAYGFGSDVNSNGIVVVGSAGTGVIIEQNVLGTTASSFTAPALIGQGSSIQTGATGGFVRNNLIGFSGSNGLRMNGSAWTVTANEIRGNGTGSADGLWGYFGSDMTIEGNLITDSASGGYDGLNRSSFTNNTVTYNGRDTSSSEDYGVSVVGDGSMINRNIFTQNTGQAVLIYTNVQPSTLDNWVSQNSMFANGKLGIDLVSGAGNTVGDNVSVNDANDSDTGANRLLNFPQIQEANLVGGSLTLRGCAPAGAIIELFEADVSPSSSSGVVAGANQLGKTLDYGEGERYLLSLTEGVGEDASSNPVNCASLTDTDSNNATGMNPFQWTLALPSNLVLGDKLTATATLSGTGTSEFSAATMISQALDYSDAPASYGNPAHTIDSGIYLGSNLPDSEAAQPTPLDSTGDDVTGTDDEDGVTLPPALTQGQLIALTATVTGAGGRLQAWIDWNADGDFADSGEQIAKNLADNAGIDTDATAGVITFNVTPPATATVGNSYARFRWSTQSNLTTTAAANDGEVEDYAVTIAANTTALSIAGRVFNDANVDGVDNTEAGIKEVTVVLFDSTANTCQSTRTNAQGEYQFLDLVAGDYQVFEAANAKVPTPATCPPAVKDPNGYVSSTPNNLAITLSTAAVNDADFGDVRAPTFSLDNSKVILPNSTVTYPHTFQAYAEGNVLFSLSETADPSTLNWGATLFLDNDCDAKLGQGDTPITSALAINAGTKLCLLTKVTAPADAPTDAQHVLTVTSDFQYGDASLIAASNIQTHTDRTQTSAGTNTEEPNKPISGEGKLSLEKSVWNLTRNIDGSVALPGETLRYTIHYENIGNGLLNELAIQDIVPEFTQLVPNSLACGTAPAGLSACSPQATGTNLSWSFTGQLKAGAKGQVSYEVVVE